MFLFIGNSFSFVAIIWYTYCMSEVLQANIFFFITSVAVILFTLLLCIALYHVVKILKSIRRVMEKVEAGSEVIAEDLSNIRDYFKEGGFISQLLGLFMGMGGGTSRKKKKTKQAKKSS